MNGGNNQRWRQSIGLVRKAFLLTLTVSNSELWVTEVSELPNWEGTSGGEYRTNLHHPHLRRLTRCPLLMQLRIGPRPQLGASLDTLLACPRLPRFSTTSASTHRL
jgi:hypothetical protein